MLRTYWKKVVKKMNTMHKADDYIERELIRCKNLNVRFRRRYNKISKSSNHESLTYTEKNGRRYYSEIWEEKGERETRYLGTDENEEVKEIKEKHFLKKALKLLDKHIPAIESCLTKFNYYDCDKINKSLPKTYQLSEQHLKQLIGESSEEKWYKEGVRAKELDIQKYGVGYRKGYRHKAKDGTWMRSKSEVAIANEFINRGKPYIYEMPFYVGNVRIHPDFAFYSNRFDKVMIWEHAGMLGDKTYKDDFATRADIYTRGGFVNGVDMVFTFDSINGNLDTRIIEKMLDYYQ